MDDDDDDIVLDQEFLVQAKNHTINEFRSELGSVGISWDEAYSYLSLLDNETSQAPEAPCTTEPARILDI